MELPLEFRPSHSGHLRPDGSQQNQLHLIDLHNNVSAAQRHQERASLSPSFFQSKTVSEDKQRTEAVAWRRSCFDMSVFNIIFFHIVISFDFPHKTFIDLNCGQQSKNILVLFF